MHYLGEPTPPAGGVVYEHVSPSLAEVEAFVTSMPHSVAVEEDLSAAGATGRLLDRVEELTGPVDVLVNNAAPAESPDTFETASEGGLSRHCTGPPWRRSRHLPVQRRLTSALHRASMQSLTDRVDRLDE